MWAGAASVVFIAAIVATLIGDSRALYVLSFASAGALGLSGHLAEAHGGLRQRSLLVSIVTWLIPTSAFCFIAALVI